MLHSVILLKKLYHEELQQIIDIAVLFKEVI